jgi:tRNA A37 N6-isopentenylltransferase MiaA
MQRHRNFTWRLPELRPAVAIYGPTSSGKTALSLDVCEAASGHGLRPVVLNADSRQYREFVRVAASTGKPITELDGADLAAARAEALGHIRAYSRRQRSWFRKLGASRVHHRSAVKVIMSRLR